MKMKKKTSKSKLLKIEPKQPRKHVEPDEWYEAIFTGSEVKESAFANNKGSEYLQLDFKLTDNKENVTEDGESAKDLILNAIAGLPVRMGNRVYNLITAIVGKELTVDEDVDLAAFYGHKYMVFVEDKETKDDEGINWQKVSKVKGIKKKAKVVKQ